MIRRMALVRILAALLCAIALTHLPGVAAAPFAVQVGDARIGLDAPPGFADTAFAASPRLQELGESLTSASNRILLFAVSDADLRRFTLGDPLELRRYMLVVTPRSGERERMTPEAFKTFSGDALRKLGQLPAEKDYRKILDGRPTDTPSLLAELRQEADVATVLQGMRSKGSGLFSGSKYFLSTSTLLLLRGKALNLSVFTEYADAADLEWIGTTTARWIEELKRLNPR
jgi:hypothetical protein